MSEQPKFLFVVRPNGQDMDAHLIAREKTLLLYLCETEDPAAFIEQGPGGEAYFHSREVAYKYTLDVLTRPLEDPSDWNLEPD